LDEPSAAGLAGATAALLCEQLAQTDDPTTVSSLADALTDLAGYLTPTA
jgi:hypothetical protein